MDASPGKGIQGGAVAESAIHDDDGWKRDGRTGRWGGEFQTNPGNVKKAHFQTNASIPAGTLNKWLQKKNKNTFCQSQRG